MKVNRSLYERHVRVFRPGDVIFKELDPGYEMYVIIDGKVEIRKVTSPTSSKTLIVLGKGDIFGEMAIIDKKKRSATAMAVADTRVLVLNDHLFEATLERNPDFARKMILILSERLRRANAAIQQSLVSNREHHVMNGLVQYSEEFGTATFKGKRINLEEFLDWACVHIGISEKDIRPVLDDLLQREVLKTSARGKEDVIFKPTQSY
jgi:CRP/FNR family cyclic AMP-dependent transcriptional regulator